MLSETGTALLERLLSRFSDDELKRRLLDFLRETAATPLTVAGETIEVQTARKLLQELIPTRIEVRSVCARSVAAVAAAPHVSFDNWSEYFCNRAARQLGLGRVIAQNFRDQDGRRIPVSIGRHLHVNRPFESEGPGEPEHETPRAREVLREYLAALTQAAGRASLPMDVLVEFHSHRRTPFLEIATAGLTADRAEELAMTYRFCRRRTALLPELRIEPIHELQWKADGAKTYGSLRAEVAKCALHVEVPREARQEEEFRAQCSAALIELLASLLKRIEKQ